MNKVTVQEVVDALNMEAPHYKILDSEYPVSQQRKDLASRIQTHGIAPPDGDRAYVCRDCRAVYLEPNVSCDCLGESGYDDAVISMLAPTPKQEVKPNDKWGAENGWMPFDESTAINATQVKPEVKP